MNEAEKIVAALVGPMQAVEDAFQALMTQRRIGTAVGAQLDVLARLVGAIREGHDDDTLRRIIPIQIVANRSDGITEDLILIARLVSSETPRGGIVVQRDGDATVRVRVEDELDFDIAQFLIRMLKIAVSGGVRVILDAWLATSVDEMFSFDAFPGETGTGKGFGSTLDSSVGGVFASVLE